MKSKPLPQAKDCNHPASKPLPQGFVCDFPIVDKAVCNSCYSILWKMINKKKEKKRKKKGKKRKKEKGKRKKEKGE
jgi:hypothetical protein